MICFLLVPSVSVPVSDVVSTGTAETIQCNVALKASRTCCENAVFDLLEKNGFGILVWKTRFV